MPNLTRRELNALVASALALPFTQGTARSASKFDLPPLRGVNFAGLSSESWSQPPPLGAVNYYIRQKKMNVVRLNFPWEFLQPELFCPLNEKNTLIVQQQVDRITGAGAYVILEFHNYQRRKVDGVERIIGEHPSLTSEHFSDAWTKMAIRWKDNDKVIFELMNEPHDCDTATLVQVSNDAIAAIRATGARNLIMLCGNDWNSMGWREGSSNLTHMLDIVDPLDLFCFDVHHYFDDWSQGQTHNVRTDPVSSMHDFTKWAKAHGKKGFCGEFGCSVNKRGMEACSALLDHLQQNPDVYLGWAWWGGGGPWQPDYEYLLDPFASYTSPTNPDPQGSKTWHDAVDRPQMKLLQKYLPEGATPFNAWLIEDQLSDQIEAMYRHGDFVEKANVRFEYWSLYWRWIRLQLDLQFGSGVPLPANFAGEDYIWIDSGPLKKNATVLVANLPLQPPKLAADKQGGVALKEAGELLISEARLAGMRIYAMIAGDTVGMNISSTIAAFDDGSGKRGYQLTVSNTAAAKAGTERSRVSDGKGPKLLVETRPDPATQTEATWSLGMDGSEVKEVTVATTEVGVLVIGAADLDGNGGLHTTLYDLLIVPADISDRDHARIQGRLHWDLGIANRLPPDHPYRLRPPSLG